MDRFDYFLFACLVNKVKNDWTDFMIFLWDILKG